MAFITKENSMSRKFAAMLVSVVLLGLGTVSPYVAAQTENAASQSTVSAKKAARAQRKAARKAARAKNHKELGALEKNGYQPAADNATYPTGIQQGKAKAETGAPASAP